MRMSIFPHRSITVFAITADRTESCNRGVTRNNQVVWPRGSRKASASFRAAEAQRAPRIAAGCRSQTCAPIPSDAPVTIMTFPLREPAFERAIRIGETQ